MKIGILAGEPSGDILGASLITALRQANPHLNVTGIGGSAMIAAGCHSLYEMDRLSVMGIIEPLCRITELIKIRRGVYHHFLQNPPDVFIGIDSPDFNLGLELKLRQANIPIVHYVSPSVWAWRKKRIFKIAKAVDLMLTLFPFEADFYKQHSIPVRFVGHPLADNIPLQSDQLSARKKLQLDPEKMYIAILPGSRQNEIKYLGNVFIEAAYQCWKQRPHIQFITSAVNASRDTEFQEQCRKIAPDLPIHFFQGRSHAVMEAADAVLMTSGTATLEAMLYKRPMVIAYKMHSLTYQIAKHLVKVPFIGLPNLLANEKIVPEFIQDAATAAALSSALLNYVDHPERVEQLQKKFMELHIALRCNASEQAAEAIIQLIKSSFSVV